MYSIIRFYDINNKITKKLKFSFEPILDSSFGAPAQRNPILLYDNPIQYMETYKSNIIYNCYQKDKLILSIYIPNGMKGIYSYKLDGKVVYANKVLCDDGKNVKVYDENDNLITESEDTTIHNYLLGVKITNYNGPKMLEYYPKTNKTIIRLLNKTNNVDTIIEKDISEIKTIDIKDQLENIINTVNNRNIYILENNYSAIKITNPDKTFRINFTDSNGEF